MRNPDESLRRRERAASSGDPHATLAMLRSQARAGQLESYPVNVIMAYEEAAQPDLHEWHGTTSYLNEWPEGNNEWEFVSTSLEAAGKMSAAGGKPYMLITEYGDLYFPLSDPAFGTNLAADIEWLRESYRYIVRESREADARDARRANRNPPKLRSRVIKSLEKYDSAVISAYVGSKKAGHIQVTKVRPGQLDQQCQDDLLQIQGDRPGITPYAVWKSHVYEPFREKGIGNFLYEAALDYVREKHAPGAAALVPMSCLGYGTTSLAAMRVWSSLARRREHATERAVLGNPPPEWLRIETNETPGQLVLMAYDNRTEKNVGSLYADMRRSYADRLDRWGRPPLEIARVTNVDVEPEYQREGIATALYQVAAERAAARGWHLASDTSLTRMSRGFWRKQVRKGRARKTSKLAARGATARLRRYVLDPALPETLENPADRAYRFVTDCIHSTGADINRLVDGGSRISMRTFQRRLAPGEWLKLSKRLGYDRHLPLSRDEFVGYFEGTYRNTPAVYLVYSGIEQIFTPAGEQGPSLDPGFVNTDFRARGKTGWTRLNPPSVSYMIQVDGEAEDLELAGLRNLSDRGARTFFRESGAAEELREPNEIYFESDGAFGTVALNLSHSEGRVKTKRAVDAIVRFIQANGYHGLRLDPQAVLIHVSGVEWTDDEDTWNYSWPPDLQRTEDIWRGI